MTAEATTTAVSRPRTRAEALALASDLTQCPGLVDVLQTLGYSLGAEIEKLLASLD